MRNETYFGFLLLRLHYEHKSYVLASSANANFHSEAFDIIFSSSRANLKRSSLLSEIVIIGIFFIKSSFVERAWWKPETFIASATASGSRRNENSCSTHFPFMSFLISNDKYTEKLQLIRSFQLRKKFLEAIQERCSSASQPDEFWDIFVERKCLESLQQWIIPEDKSSVASSPTIGMGKEWT